MENKKDTETSEQENEVTEKTYEPFTEKELQEILPVILSDLKHHGEEKERVPTDANIKKDLFAHVVRTAFDKDRFYFEEKEPDSFRQGLFIKGYVREVWGYFHSAYKLIHDKTFALVMDSTDVNPFRKQSNNTESSEKTVRTPPFVVVNQTESKTRTIAFGNLNDPYVIGHKDPYALSDNILDVHYEDWKEIFEREPESNEEFEEFLNFICDRYGYFQFPTRETTKIFM